MAASTAPMEPHPPPMNVSMDPPAHAVYSSLEELIGQSNNHALAHGYKLVVVRSKTNAAGQKTWVQLACDRHGTKRNTHNLTEETRKKNRRSRRCECPMYCVASKQTAGLWELTIRNGEHNHSPYEQTPKKRKVEQAPRHNSELINLPLLQTPSACIADFCLVPIGTGSASVSHEIAEVQRLLKRSGLSYEMNASGTTIEGPWDDVMRLIGQAHSYLHGNGVVRIQTDIRVGSRTDKKQTPQDKVAAVNAHLNNQPMPQPQQQPEDALAGTADLTDTTPRGMRQSLPSQIESVIAPNLDPQMVGPPPPHPGQPHQHLHMPPPFHPHLGAPHMDQSRLPPSSLSGFNNMHSLQHKG